MQVSFEMSTRVCFPKHGAKTVWLFVKWPYTVDVILLCDCASVCVYIGMGSSAKSGFYVVHFSALLHSSIAPFSLLSSPANTLSCHSSLCFLIFTSPFSFVFSSPSLRSSFDRCSFFYLLAVLPCALLTVTVVHCKDIRNNKRERGNKVFTMQKAGEEEQRRATFIKQLCDRTLNVCCMCCVYLRVRDTYRKIPTVH